MIFCRICDRGIMKYLWEIKSIHEFTLKKLIESYSKNQNKKFKVYANDEKRSLMETDTCILCGQDESEKERSRFCLCDENYD